MRVELYCGDCLEVMKSIPDKSVDAVITDPPYFNIANEEWDKQWANVKEWGAWCNLWGKEVCRILKDNGSAIIFGDEKNIAYMQINLDILSWGLINHIVWKKTNYTALKSDPEALRSFAVQGEEHALYYGKDISFPSFSEFRNPECALPMAAYLRGERERSGVTAKEIAKLFPSKSGGMTGCVSNWELGLNFPTKEQYEKIREYLNKSGKYEFMRREYEDMRREYEDMRREYEDMRRPFNGYRYTDIWEGPAISGANKDHPSQKPDWIISRSITSIANQGAVICDPFMGSGTTGKCSTELGYNFIGIEIDEGYFKIAQKRIHDAQQQMRIEFPAEVSHAEL